MKLITLRIDAEEKARLEQLAEQGHVTLSRALREGAALYLSDVQGKLHRARGGEATFFGVRRDRSGRPLNKRTPPSPTEQRRLTGMRGRLYEDGLQAIRRAWDDGERPAVVLGALAQWLSVVGRVYVSNATEVGWDWFLRDYCRPYANPEASAEVRREISAGLLRGSVLNVGTVLQAIDAGFLRFLDDAENVDVVRRTVLPAWQVLSEELAL